ncbi:hypothetical protein XENOCAPTIV_017263 [Xenoophorus captivus]|uniref:ubiquitinyl hydrolase 1 n=1 Tax=Xenoophorus captivus TaxID=1517983 RepID=A0ABV0QM23_9TELE
MIPGEYFTPVDLSSIAHQLDEEERMRMAEGGMASEEYRTFLQVISNALRVWGLELILFNSPEYQRLMINPITSGSQSQADVGFSVEDDDEELKRALALSRQDMDVEDEEADVRRAIQLSMQGTVRSERSSECEVFDVKSGIAGDEQKGGQSETLTAEELRKRRQAYFDR